MSTENRAVAPFSPAPLMCANPSMCMCCCCL